MATRGDAPDRAIRIAVLAALFLLAAVTTRLLLSGWVIDPDLLYHLASGRWIVQHGTIPTTDVLSWYGLAHHTRWLPHEWLFDVLMYLTYKASGFQGIFAITSALLGAAILCARRLAELRGASWLGSLAVALVALAGMARFISPRPGAITFVLLPLIAIMLERERWIPALLLFVLAMNVHGGTYPIYLLLIAYYASPKKPWMLATACVLVLAQPLTFGMLKYPFFTLDPLLRYIREFQPTLLGADYLFLAVLVGVWLLLDRDRAKPRDIVAAGFLAALSLTTVRAQAYFYLLGLPLLVPYFRLPGRGAREVAASDAQPAVQPDAERLGLSQLGEAARRPRNPRTADVALLVALLVCVVLVGVRIPRGPIDADKGYPRGALAYVRTHAITHFWNEWNDGGYIMFQGVPPFVDGRADPFATFFNPGTTVGLEYMRTYRMESDIRPFLRKYGVDHLIVHREQPLYQLLLQSRDFRLLYQDPVAGVFAFVPSGS